MGRFIFGLVFLASSLLSACATNISTKVHQINDLANAAHDTGSFGGIESMARPAPSTENPNLKRVNIIYIHGIGWTENADSPELGNSFLRGIADAYSDGEQKSFINNRCRLGHHDTSEGELDHTFIETTEDVFYETGLKGSGLKLRKLACMDRQVLHATPDLDFVVYRVFWDDTFWDSLQSAHVGYDDFHGSNNALASMRKKYNRELKDDIVNYGFSDAVMYLGPAGDLIREAIHTAVCSAAQSAAGNDFGKQGHIITKAKACQNTAYSRHNSPAPFVFVTESLGSKILFDVLKNIMSDGKIEPIDHIAKDSEIFMLANQIPLLSLSNLSAVSTTPNLVTLAPKDRPRIIAFTELNDFLSYELVPFYENLYMRAHDLRDGNGRRSRDALARPGVRRQMIEDIGFDIIDMRVEFADPLIPILSSFVDPKQAHSDHAKQPILMRHMLCGAKDGSLKNEGCIAASSRK